MFVLLGRDKHAPTLVWLWSVLRELDGEDPATVEEARQCVKEMVQYAVKKGKKVSGLAESILAGIMDLIRVANFRAETFLNDPTNPSDIRMILSRFRVEEDNGHETSKT